MKDGIVLVDKERGWTSHDVCAYLSGRWKWGKTGHAGTLDPGATGLLIILVGSATKYFEEFKKFDKEYEAVVEFGKTTSTDDADGEVTCEYAGVVELDRDVLEKILIGMTGEILQIPPKISSIKIHGVPAHRQIRKGKDVQLEPRPVRINEAKLTDIDGKKARIIFKVGSGTYIRSIARDLGEKTGFGAFVKELRRTEIGDWQVSRAKNIKEISSSDIQDFSVSQ